VRHSFPVGRAGAALLAVFLATACGGDSDGDVPTPQLAGTATPVPTSAGSTPAAAVTVEDAVAVALEAVGGGDVVETDAEEFDVVIQVWEVTVVTPDGVRHQVAVDMTNGSVVGKEVDD
jgi:uncharacterized membrane protein YkoI